MSKQYVGLRKDSMKINSMNINFEMNITATGKVELFNYTVFCIVHVQLRRTFFIDKLF